MRTYLLERSRLVFQPETERNYHIFYQLLAGAPASDLNSLGLDDASNFHYLCQGGPSAKVIPGVDDATEFQTTQNALSIVGITSERQWQIFHILAALLHLGNVQITQARTDAILSDDEPSLQRAMKLLGIDLAEFKKWTIKKQITTRSEKIVSALSGPQATVVRDSVAKYIYACLFEWLVAVINDSLTSEGLDEKVQSFIGVLDIYGFEHFKKNRSVCPFLTVATRLIFPRTASNNSVSTMPMRSFSSRSVCPSSSRSSVRSSTQNLSFSLSSMLKCSRSNKRNIRMKRSIGKQALSREPR
jgi:myosin V